MAAWLMAAFSSGCIHMWSIDSSWHFRPRVTSDEIPQQALQLISGAYHGTAKVEVKVLGDELRLCSSLGCFWHEVRLSRNHRIQNVVLNHLKRIRI